MAKSQHLVVGFCSLIFGLLAIPLIYTYSFRWDGAATPCITTPYFPATVLGASTPIILLGGLVAATAVLGFVGGFWRFRGLAVVYFASALLAVALVGALAGFLYAATRGVSGHDRPSMAPAGPRLREFPGWIRARVESPEKWERIKGCLVAADLCAELEQMYRIPQDFFNARVTSLQGGCCKPPTECGYTYGGPTYWSFPNNTGAGVDCLMWSNNQTQLCYACESCKAALLATLAAQWRVKDYFLFAVLCGLIVVYLVALCAFIAGPPPRPKY